MFLLGVELKFIDSHFQ